MNLYAAAPESLWSSPSFVRFMACSVVAHGVVILLVAYGPIFRLDSVMVPQPVMVNLDVDMPAEQAPPEPAPPEPAPPEPPPPEPAPPEPPPEKPPEPEQPKQVVEEDLYVPSVPAEKPQPPKKKKPEPKPEKPKDVADVMASLRKDVEKRTPAPAPNAASGALDPELAAYLRSVKACLDTNWVGAQRFQRRRDLQVQLIIEVNTTGRVQSVEVERGSGEDQLDDTAERAVLKCSPSLPPPPSGRNRIPIVFSPGEIE